MKIESTPDSYIGSVAGGPNKAAPTTAGEAAAAGASASSAAAAAKPQAGVQVTLSSATQSLSATGSGSSDVFNAEKVEAMKAAIANGSFQVNAEAIADKMLANAAEMLNGARSA
ncbi:flagellar biosynthesis anti-sigma factor FlgM [uncultured Hydrogenophaga sp.]|uniref:flagellar biosynthesis anti-sigma factor FlgM n=1 Tax=uncultured Hydrogenophaga sp. TaxID=199683 RepID=UPI002660232F|nr:flagellar biosynthesis anti-sigma factor FlgM [uncultured Hydrogenophaga sp.]